MLPEALLQYALSFADKRSLVSFARTSRARLAWCKMNVEISLVSSREALDLVLAGWKFAALLVTSTASWQQLGAIWTQETRHYLRQILFVSASQVCYEDLLSCKDLQLLSIEYWDIWKQASNCLDFSMFRNLASFHMGTSDRHKIETLTFDCGLNMLSFDPGATGRVPFVEASGLTQLRIRGRLHSEWERVNFPSLQVLHCRDTQQSLDVILQPLSSAQLTSFMISNFATSQLDLRPLRRFDQLRVLLLGTSSTIHFDQEQLLHLPRTLETLGIHAKVTTDQCFNLDVIGQQCPELVDVAISLNSDAPVVWLDVTAWDVCQNLEKVSVGQLSEKTNLPEHPNRIWPALKSMRMYSRNIHRWQASSPRWSVY